MFKKFIFITILAFIVSCNEDVKLPVPKEDKKAIIIDTLQVAGLNLDLELKDQLGNDKSIEENKDLLVTIKNGDFKNLGSYYYGSERYSSLLKIYNGYTTAEVEVTSLDSIKIPTFEKLVYLNKEEMSRTQKRNTSSLLSVYESYIDIENQLRSVSASSETNVVLTDDVKKQLSTLSNNVAVIYSSLQEQEERPHEAIGELKALSSYFARMTKDSLQSNDKSVDIVHYRLAAAFTAS